MSSTPSTPSDELIVPARFEHLRHITAFVRREAQVAGFSAQLINRIELAVDEACSNIIQHAYSGRDDGDIRISVSTIPSRRITIAIVDTGVPFEPSDVPDHDPAAALDELKIGGLGLYLMRQTMDEVHFEFDLPGVRSGEPPRYNRLTLIKYM